MNHITVGVYANQTFKTNVVPPQDLENHTKYNLRMRPGRAFFVDGMCFYRGDLTEQECLEWEERIQYMNIDPSIPSKQYQ